MATEQLDLADEAYKQAQTEFAEGLTTIAYVHMKNAYILTMTSYRDDMNVALQAMDEQKKSIAAYKALAEQLAEQAMKIANTALKK